MIYNTARNISEKKGSKSVLSDSESLLASVLESSLDGIMAFQSVRNVAGTIVDFEWILANPRAGELTRRNPSELLGKRLLQEMPIVRDYGLFDRYIDVVESGEPSRQELFFDVAGVRVWYHLTAVKLNDGFAITFRDVTHEREAEEMRLAMATAKMGTWELDLATYEVKRSLTTDELFGLPADGATRKIDAYIARIHPEDRPGFQKALEEYSVEQPHHTVEYRIIQPDNSIRWIASRGKVIFDGNGQAIRKIGALTDITEQKKASEALRLSEERFRIVLQNSPILVFNQDRDLRYTWVYNYSRLNRSHLPSDGNPNGAILGKRDADIMARPCEAQAIEALKYQVIESGKGTRQEVQISEWNEGPTHTFDLTLEPLRNMQGEVIGLTGAAIDITDHKENKAALQERARQQAAIAALGQQALTGKDLHIHMQNAVALVTDTLNVEYGKILELLPDGNKLLLRAGIGWSPKYAAGEAIISAGLESQAGYTLRMSEPVIVEDCSQEARFAQSPLLEEHNVVSGLGVVIEGQQKPYGVLSAHTAQRRSFSIDQVNFLRSVANLLAITLERRHAELEQVRLLEEVRTAHAEHQRSLAQLRAIFDSITEGLIIINPDGYVYEMNPAALSLHGFTSQAEAQLDLHEFLEQFVLYTLEGNPLPLEDWPASRALRQERFHTQEVWVQRKDTGDEWFGSYSGMPVYDSNGSFLFAVLTVRDITEQKQSEQAIQASEARFRGTFENAAVGMAQVTLGGHWIRVNERMCQIIGYSADELLNGMSFQNISHPDDLARDLQLLDQLIRNEIQSYQLEKRYFHKDGHIVWVNLTAALQRDKNGYPLNVISVIEDITERKQAEDALREARRQQTELLALLEASLASAPIGFAFFDREHRCTRINETLIALSCLPAGDHIDKKFSDLLPGVAPQFDPLIEQVFNSHQAIENFEVTDSSFDNPDRIRHWLISLYPVADLAGSEPIYVGVVLVDITDRKAAEEALRESEVRFRVMAETLPDILFTCQANGSIDYINRRFEIYTGINTESVLGVRWTSVIHPEDLQRYWHDWRQAMVKGLTFENEFRLCTREGSYRWFMGRAHPIHDEHDQVVRWVGTCTDIHDKKMAEEALRHSEHQLRLFNESLEERVQQRTRQVRELASALTLAEQRERRRVSQILHDHVQQMLYGIQMRNHLLKLDTDSQTQPVILEHIGVMNELVEQAIRSTRSLSVELSPPVLKNEGLAAAFEWLAGNMREIHGLLVETRLHNDYQPASEDLRVLVFQVTRELLFNVVKHANVDRAQIEMYEKGPNIVVRVTDDGRGFDPKVVDMKQSPEGGFGLYSIQERLALFGGHLVIESQLHKGTTATIVVPRQPSMPFRQDLPESNRT